MLIKQLPNKLLFNMDTDHKTTYIGKVNNNGYNL